MNLTCPSCGARFKIKDDALGTKGRKVKCGKCDHRWHAMPEGAAAAPATAARVRAAAPAPADPTEDFAPPPPPPPPIAASAPAARAAARPAARPAARAQPVEEPEEEEDYEEEEDDERMQRGVPASMRADPPPIPPESSFEPRTPPEEPSSGGTLKYWVLLAILLIGGSAAAFFWRDLLVHHFPAANKVFMMVGFPANTLGYGLRINTPKTALDVKTRQLGVSGEIVNETGKIIEVPLLKAILLNSKGEALKSWTFDAKEPRILPGEKVSYETMTENPPTGATDLRVTFTKAEEEAKEGAAKAKAN